MESSVKCVFCGVDGDANSVSHIVPESLGGKNSPTAQSGVTCDKCNQYFGQKVESKALSSFPFIGFRVFTGVPSKKGKMPSLIGTGGRVFGTGGRVFGTGKPGTVAIEPLNEDIKSMINLGKKTQLRITAEVTEPLSVCRMLLKIGLEQLGSKFYDVALSNRVNDAREFARRPKRGSTWWFILRTNPEELINANSTELQSAIEISEFDGVLTAVLELPGISTITPLESGVIPPNQSELQEPEYRIIWGQC